MSIPDRIHFIWLGSSIPNSLQYPYRRRLLEWQRHNPQYQILLWTDQQGRELERLQLWTNKHSIVLQTIESLHWGTEQKVVLRLLEQGYFANASDLLRMRILYQWGGLYFDFDVRPSYLPLGLAAPLGILLKLQKRDEQLFSISPYAMASAAGHELLQLALWEGEQNLQLIEALPDLDYRDSEDPSVRYGATLSLTGDIIRPALAQVAGFFPALGYPWTLGLEWMRFDVSFEHFEEHSWIEGEVDHENPFYPQELLQLVRERQSTARRRMLSSILHWAAAFASQDIIVTIATVIEPFESYFGFSPKGIGLRYRRSEEVLQSIPDM